MDLPFWTSVFVIWGFFLSRFASLVQSQGDVNPGAESSPPPPPPLSPPPPPPPISPPPPSPRPLVSPPPPWSPSSPFPTPPPPPSSPHHPPPLSRRPRSLPPRKPKSYASRSQSRHAKASPPSKQKVNWGKRIGLMFAGISGIMQVGVVAFLVIKRRQLMKNSDGY